MSFAQPGRTGAAKAMVTRSAVNKPWDEIRRKIERYDIMRIMRIIKYKPTWNKEYDLEHWLRNEMKMEYPYDEISILKRIYEERIRFHVDYHTIKNELKMELIKTAESQLIWKTRRTHTCVESRPGYTIPNNNIRSENNLPTVVRFHNNCSYPSSALTAGWATTLERWRGRQGARAMK